MILVGNQRGGSANLAAHLLSPENDHVSVGEIRGFMADSVASALNESYALSRGTRCQKHMFSLSLNPPPEKDVDDDTFMDALNRVEAELGLHNQPRVLVWHEKGESRGRHLHAVWSRITPEMKAVHMPYTNNKLQTVAKSLYRDYDWDMPKGFTNKSQSDPKNYTLDEYQQAKRVGKNARAIKTAFQDAWQISDSKGAFEHALLERGYVLAKGDRRGHVAVDHFGEVYSVARQTKIKTKDIRDRLGEADSLPSVAHAKDQIAQRMIPLMNGFMDDLYANTRKDIDDLKAKRAALVEQQRKNRAVFLQDCEARHIEESRLRQARFRDGFKGLWDRVNGKHQAIIARNEAEAGAAWQRDKKQKAVMVAKQLEARKAFNADRQGRKQQFMEQRDALKADICKYEAMRGDAGHKPSRKQDFLDKRQSSATRDPSMDR